LLLENVPGLLSADGGRVFGGILKDLAQAGYGYTWDCLQARAVGAPHRRERLFLLAGWDWDPTHHWNFLADPRSARRQPESKGLSSHESANEGWGSPRYNQPQCTRQSYRAKNVAYAPSQGLSEWGPKRLCAAKTQADGGVEFELERCSGVLAYANSPKLEKGRSQSSTQKKERIAARPSGLRTARACSSNQTQEDRFLKSSLGGGPYGVSRGMDRVKGRWPAPPDGPQFKWEPPRVAFRTPHHRARLKALGNAIVPQVAEMVGRRVLSIVRGENT
jgi:DNA (cytosine-5)-methyltransferase 1